MNIGLVGEVRCVVIKEDGTIKEDTGYQKNLILNQGLDFYGGGKGTDIFHRCLVGTGNSTPIGTQNKLDMPVKIAAGTHFAIKYDYMTRVDNLYLVERTCKYTFSTMGNVNISEVGLASNGTTTTNAYMCTRALIKDAMGNPTVISVLNTEKLEVYYKIIAVFSTLDTTHQIQYTNAANEISTYDVTVRLALAGNVIYNSGVGSSPLIGLNLIGSAVVGQTSTGNLNEVTSFPGGTGSYAESFTLGEYVPNTYKQDGMYTYSLALGNGNTRCVLVCSSLGVWQIRYGSVLNDSPISKTNKDTMVLPFEFSWGRYEGVL